MHHLLQLQKQFLHEMSSEVEKALILGALIVQASRSYYFTNTEVSNLSRIIVTKYNVAKF